MQSAPAPTLWRPPEEALVSVLLSVHVYGDMSFEGTHRQL